MRPAPDKKKTRAAAGRPVDATPTAPANPLARKPLKPIGPEALKALREKIRSGQYPSDDAVVGGILRILRKAD